MVRRNVIDNYYTNATYVLDRTTYVLNCKNKECNFSGHTKSWEKWHGVLDINEKGQPMVESFSAVGALFARYMTDHHLEMRRQPPVLGMIQSAFGGSSVEAWIKTEQGDKFPLKQKQLTISS